jgi:hypothetical protein
LRKAADRLRLAVLARRPSQRPQRVLQSLGQRHEALAAQDHVRVLEARVGEPEVIQPMIQRHAGHRDGQFAHLGEIRQPQPPRLVRLAEDHVALGPVHGPPGADAPLQRAAHAARELGVAPQQFLEDRDRPHAGCGLQQRHDFRVEDLGQRIGPASAARRLLLRWQAWICLDAIRRGHAEPGACRRQRRRFGQPELHIQPRLVIVDVSSGHGAVLDDSRPAPYPIQPRPPTRPRPGGAARRREGGTAPGYARSRSALDFLLILIDALFSS